LTGVALELDDASSLSVERPTEVMGESHEVQVLRRLVQQIARDPWDQFSSQGPLPGGMVAVAAKGRST
jgi:hypothetical protein